MPTAPRVGRPSRGWLGATFGTLIVVVLLPLSVFLVIVWLLGWQLQSVLSGSMAPTYPVGSLLVVGQIDAGDVERGMALVFEDPSEPGRLVTHRVLGVDAGEALQFTTRGDANATADPLPVPARLVRGRVLWSVSQLGTLMDWLQWPRSFVALVVIPGTLLAVLEWRGRRDRTAPARDGSVGLLAGPAPDYHPGHDADTRHDPAGAQGAAP